jgi:hypothetical protein
MSKIPDGYILQADGSYSSASKKSLKKMPDEYEPHTGKESELHKQIEDELKKRRWYFVHSRTDRKTTQNLGVPDFIVAATSSIEDLECSVPVTYWIEVKRKGNKLSPEQTITKHILTALGHNYACVYSFEEFLSVINK